MRTLKTSFLAFCLSLLCLNAFAAAVTYPGPPATDTSGTAVTSGVTDAIVSVTDLDGNAISSPGAVAHIAGGNPSVVYDAAAKGEAWVTYSLTASGHTFANQTLFCSDDPQTIASANTQATSAATSSTANGTAIAGIPAAVAAYNVGGTAGTLSHSAAQAISASIQGGSYLAGTLNTGTHQQTVTYYLPGTTLSAMNAGSATVIDTALVTYNTGNTAIVSRVDTPGTF
jgi:hypothetical protein